MSRQVVVNIFVVLIDLFEKIRFQNLFQQVFSFWTRLIRKNRVVHLWWFGVYGNWLIW